MNNREKKAGEQRRASTAPLSPLTPYLAFYDDQVDEQVPFTPTPSTPLLAPVSTPFPVSLPLSPNYGYGGLFSPAPAPPPTSNKRKQHPIDPVGDKKSTQAIIPKILKTNATMRQHVENFLECIIHIINQYSSIDPKYYVCPFLPASDDRYLPEYKLSINHKTYKLFESFNSFFKNIFFSTEQTIDVSKYLLQDTQSGLSGLPTISLKDFEYFNSKPNHPAIVRHFYIILYLSDVSHKPENFAVFQAAYFPAIRYAKALQKRMREYDKKLELAKTPEEKAFLTKRYRAS